MGGVIRPLTRDVLEKIFKDQRTIRFFEQLFETTAVDTVTLEGVEIQAGNANAKAQQALDQLAIEKSYGAFKNTANQVAGAVNTPTAAIYNETQISNGVSIDGTVTSRIVADKSGLFNFEFRVQVG